MRRCIDQTRTAADLRSNVAFFAVPAGAVSVPAFRMLIGGLIYVISSPQTDFIFRRMDL